MTGLGHECLCSLVVEVFSNFLEIMGIVGSAMRIPVAGIVLGAANVPGMFEENTPKTVPPFIPPTKEATSPPTTGF